MAFYFENPLIKVPLDQGSMCVRMELKRSAIAPTYTKILMGKVVTSRLFYFIW